MTTASQVDAAHAAGSGEVTMRVRGVHKRGRGRPGDSWREQRFLDGAVTTVMGRPGLVRACVLKQRGAAGST